MLVQLIQGGSGTLRADYPALINLLAACFFPVGLLMLVLTGQELVTAHLSAIVDVIELTSSVHAHGAHQKARSVLGGAAQLDYRVLWEPCGCPVLRRLYGYVDRRSRLEHVLTGSTLLGALQHPRTHQVLGRGSSLQDKSRMGRVRPPGHRMQLSGLYGGMARVVGARGRVQDSRTPLPRYAVCLSWVRARHCVSFE